jgi:SAM-dependent methyltransferase
MNRGIISHLLRNLGLLFSADRVRFLIHRIKYQTINNEFRKNNPEVVLPPNYMLYESFALNYPAYYEGGRKSAKDLYEVLSKYKTGKDLNILDWGCRPGRIIRHMPDLFDDSCVFYGTDYNVNSINWCSQNISNINFSHNSLYPPLDYSDNYFDIIYGISVFTHLSKEMHFAWAYELRRVLKKDGILLITTAGGAFKSKLTLKERLRFENGDLIIRGKVKEGHRVFSAFHPALFIRDLFSGCEILDHIESEQVGNYIPQDICIIRNNSNIEKH